MKMSVTAVVLLLLAGCSGATQQWYNPGRTQVDFDQDAQECVLIAREFARQATLTGKREDPEAFARTYDGCLAAKGWSTAPPEAAAGATPGTLRPLAVYEANGTLRGFGKTFTLPAGFVLQSDVTQRHGPTLMQNLLFQGPDQSYLNFTFQQAVSRDFAPTAYPVREPFFLYEQGALRGNPDRLRWAIFAGDVQNSWVAGMGGYLLLRDRQRIAIVITKPLPRREGDPLPGLHLDARQIQAMELFRGKWLPWLEGPAAS